MSPVKIFAIIWLFVNSVGGQYPIHCFYIDCFYNVDLIQGFTGPSVYLPSHLKESCNYCSLSSQNTYCLYQNNPTPHERCGRRPEITYGVNAKERRQILKIHNDLRRKVAMGQEKYIRGQPKASNMMELNWSEELAKGAQLWANQCRFSHDSANTCKYRVGQNLFISGGPSSDKDPEWKRGLHAWYDEVKDFGSTSISSYKPTLGKVTGHFTQIIWAKTREIGCGYISYPSQNQQFKGLNKYYVCNYGPAGNVMTNSIFKIGEVCTNCPQNTKCNEGLCKVAHSDGEDLNQDEVPEESEVDNEEELTGEEGGSTEEDGNGEGDGVNDDNESVGEVGVGGEEENDEEAVDGVDDDDDDDEGEGSEEESDEEAVDGVDDDDDEGEGGEEESDEEAVDGADDDNEGVGDEDIGGEDENNEEVVDGGDEYYDYTGEDAGDEVEDNEEAAGGGEEDSEDVGGGDDGSEVESEDDEEESSDYVLPLVDDLPLCRQQRVYLKKILKIEQVKKKNTHTK